MATTFQDIYDKFLAKILDDEWLSEVWTDEAVSADLRSIMEGALVWFKFPASSFERGDTAFTDTLTQEEQQVISSFMVTEWLGRKRTDWASLNGLLFNERDYSPANFLDKLNSSYKLAKETSASLERTYYRSRNKKPFDFTSLAGS